MYDMDSTVVVDFDGLVVAQQFETDRTVALLQPAHAFHKAAASSPGSMRSRALPAHVGGEGRIPRGVDGPGARGEQVGFCSQLSNGCPEDDWSAERDAVMRVWPGSDRRFVGDITFGMARLIQLVTPAMRKNHYGKIVNISSMGGNIPSKLELVAKTVCKAVTRHRPRTRYLIGFGAKPMVWTHKIFGDRVFDWVIKKL